MSQAKMQAAKELIEEKHYDVARAVLKTVDHPKAREWIIKLDKIAPEIDLDDPFANIPASPKTEPRIPAPPITHLPARPIQFEYKTVSIEAGVLQNLDKMVDRKINEMLQYGWEFIDMKEKLGGWAPKGRVLQFKRPKW